MKKPSKGTSFGNGKLSNKPTRKSTNFDQPRSLPDKTLDKPITRDPRQAVTENRPYDAWGW